MHFLACISRCLEPRMSDCSNWTCSVNLSSRTCRSSLNGSHSPARWILRLWKTERNHQNNATSHLGQQSVLDELSSKRCTALVPGPRLILHHSPSLRPSRSYKQSQGREYAA